MKKFLNEFKNFALRGNVMDMAVGVIIGAAFQAIVTSLTNDVISPFIGLFGKTDFSSMVLTLRGVDIRYGAFITAVINFIIMAFIIFLLVKVLNKITSLGHHDKPEAPATKDCPYCCSKISIKAVKCPHCTSELPADILSEDK